MGEKYIHALEWLVKDQAITSTTDLKRGAEVVAQTAKKYPDYYHDQPTGKEQEIETGIFRAELLTNFMAGRCGSNQLLIYQQEMVKKLIELRRL